MIMMDETKEMYLNLLKEHTNYIEDRQFRKYVIESLDTNEDDKKAKVAMQAVEKSLYDEYKEIKKEVSQLTPEQRRNVLNSTYIDSYLDKILPILDGNKTFSKLFDKSVKINIKYYKQQVEKNKNRKPGIVKNIVNIVLNFLLSAIGLQMSTILTRAIFISDNVVHRNGVAIMGILDSIVSKIKFIIDKLTGAEKKAGTKRIRESVEPVDESLTVFLGVPVTVLLLTQIVPMLREITYFFYYSKIKTADIITSISDAIEYNSLNIKKQNASEEELQKIIQKQQKIASRLREFADKLKFIPVSEKKAKDAAEQKIHSTRATLDMVKNVDDDAEFSISI